MRSKLYQYVSVHAPKNEDEEETILNFGVVLAENENSARTQIARQANSNIKSEEIKIFIKEFSEEVSYHIRGGSSYTLTAPSYGASSWPTLLSGSSII